MMKLQYSIETLSYTLKMNLIFLLEIVLFLKRNYIATVSAPRKNTVNETVTELRK